MATQLFNDAAIAVITSIDNADYLIQADASTGELSKITGANAKASFGAPVMGFGVTLSQSGTSAPTENVIFNNTGATFSYARSGAGDYDLIASSTIFPAGNMIMLATNGASPAAISIARTDSSTLNIKCSGDDILSIASIRVEIY